ncbi:unnamed protein product [Acanthoscelides obtectus]|uniref:Uncharacterized protein n=1 Tax=Acanthoscelides obtectus TaxID=200917 RepID=A0A9P0NRM0_ACAOB|nr:unnamed protein product [Acanthoscelides obtectus]CAK1661296.1 hypothetical protein AOBTE_LOCUS22552 [Acanthoscelides obtectus]
MSIECHWSLLCQHDIQHASLHILLQHHLAGIDLYRNYRCWVATPYHHHTYLQMLLQKDKTTPSPQRKSERQHRA